MGQCGNGCFFVLALCRGIIQTSGPNMLVFDPERKQEDFFFKNEKIRGKQIAY